MILTQGEKMVWATAFVQSYEKYGRNPIGIPVKEEQIACMINATNFAESMVKELRKATKLEGVRDDAMQMLRAMLGDGSETAIEFTEETANEFLSRARSRMELDTMRGGRR